MIYTSGAHLNTVILAGSPPGGQFSLNFIPLLSVLIGFISQDTLEGFLSFVEQNG